jgi:hypothetical protein
MNSIYKFLLCAVAAVSADSNSLPLLNTPGDVKKYYILSLESSMYKGYMQSKFLEYIEMRSYTIAMRDSTEQSSRIKPRTSKKIAIPELFDMIAGSETGAILATYLSIKNDGDNKEI